MPQWNWAQIRILAREGRGPVREVAAAVQSHRVTAAVQSGSPPWTPPASVANFLETVEMADDLAEPIRRVVRAIEEVGSSRGQETTVHYHF